MGIREFGVGGLLLALLALPTRAQESQDVDQRLKQLEQQNQAILERLKEAERRNEELQARSNKQLETEVEKYLESTKALEHGSSDPIKTKKGAFLTFYGFLRLDAYYNSGRFNSVIVPFLVRPENSANRNDNEFALDVRLTRLGFDFGLGEIGDFKSTGKLEIDFANFPSGTTESRETPRIRLAYFQLDNGKWFIGFGQYWDVISPLYPNINHEGVMWLAGNLGDRRPMIRWFYRASDSFTIDTALGLSGAITGEDLDGLGVRDGFDAGFPNVQVRAAWTKNKAVIGVWGFIAQIETDVAYDGHKHFTSWCGGIDFTTPIGSLLVLRGEAWYGAALGDVRGSIGQSIDKTLGSEVEGWGGWIEIVFRPNDKWQFYGGGTIDDPDDSTISLPAPGDAAKPTNNWTGYIGVRRHFSKRFRVTCDVIYWETEYRDGGLGNAVRVNMWTSWDF